MNTRPACCCGSCDADTICFPRIWYKREWTTTTDRGVLEYLYIEITISNLCMVKISAGLWYSVAGTVNITQSRSGCVYPFGTYYESICGTGNCPSCNQQCCVIFSDFHTETGGTAIQYGDVILECLDPCPYTPTTNLLNMRFGLGAWGTYRSGGANTGSCFATCAQSWSVDPYDDFLTYRFDVWFPSCCITPDAFRCRIVDQQTWDCSPFWNAGWCGRNIPYPTSSAYQCRWPPQTGDPCCHQIVCMGEYEQRVPSCGPAGDETPGEAQMLCQTVPHGTDALHYDVQSCDTGAWYPTTEAMTPSVGCSGVLAYPTTCVSNLPSDCSCASRVATPCCGTSIQGPIAFYDCTPTLYCYGCDNTAGRLLSYRHAERLQTAIDEPTVNCTCEY